MAIGTAVMPVIPSLKGMSGSIEKELGRGGIGKAAGKNVSGGILGGVKAVAGPMSALFAVGGAVNFFKDANDEAREAQKVGATTTQIIKSTGGAAKITSKQVGDLTSSISAKSGMDDEAIQKGANLLLTFKNVRNEAGQGSKVFDRATQSAVDLSAAGFGSVEGASKMLGKALNDPVKGIGALGKAGVTFTDQQKEQIKTLVKSGDTLGAQKIIMGEVESQVGGVAAASATAGEKMSVTFGNFKEQVGTAVMPIVDKIANVITTKALPALSSFVTYVGAKAPPAFAAIKTAVGPIITVIKSLITQFTGGSPKVTGAIGGIRAFIVAAMPVVVGAFRSVVAFIKAEVIPRFLSIVATVRQLAAVVVPIVTAIASKIVSVFRENLPTILVIFNTIKGIVTGAMELVKAVIGRVTSVVQGIWSRFGGIILKMIGTVFKAVIGVVSGALKIVSGVIKLVTSIIKGDWSGAWAAIKQIVSGAWTVIKSVVSGALGVIKGAFSAAAGVVKLVWSAFWNALKSTASRIFGAIKTGVTTVFTGIKTAFSSATGAVKTTWSNFWSGIKSTGKTAIDTVKTNIDTVLGKIKTAFSNAKTNIGKVWAGVKSIVSSPIDWIKNNVYNKPLVPVWNKVAGLVGGPKLSTYASGGIHGVRPGYTPGRDTHTIAVGGGEAIMRPEWTRAAGSSYVDGANAAARRGGLKGVQGYIDREGLPGSGPREHFAGGGIAGWARDKLSSAGSAIAGLAGKIKGWAIGGLKAAASAVLKPLRGIIGQQLSGSPVKSTIGGVANKALDLVVGKIGKADSAATAVQGGSDAGVTPGGNGLVNYKGGRFTENFANRLQAVGRKRNFHVFQGGFRPRTSYSGTSHQGDAVDVGPVSGGLVSALRGVRIAAWDRTGKGNWAPHIHGVPLPGAGRGGGSAVWQAQDYLRGGDGLKNGGIVGYAKGGVGSGLAVVGERGREVVDLGARSRVYNNRDSEAMLGGTATLAAAVREGMAGMSLTATLSGDTVTLTVDRALAGFVSSFGRGSA